MTFSQEDILKSIQYRLHTINLLEKILEELLKGADPQKEKPFAFTLGEIKIESDAAAYINSVSEAGLIHCRALLEFLGLKGKHGSPAKLTERGPKLEPDDCFIEHLNYQGRNLKPVRISEVCARLSGPAGKVEESLATTCYWANKAITHMTYTLPTDHETLELLLNGAIGVQLLVLVFVYDALKLPCPGYKLGKLKQ